MEINFNIQLFADTEISGVAPSLVMEAWAQETWEAGLSKAFFKKFMGDSAENIIHVKNELKKEAGDTILLRRLKFLQTLKCFKRT